MDARYWPKAEKEEHPNPLCRCYASVLFRGGHGFRINEVIWQPFLAVSFFFSINFCIRIFMFIQINQTHSDPLENG